MAFYLPLVTVQLKPYPCRYIIPKLYRDLKRCCYALGREDNINRSSTCVINKRIPCYKPRVYEVSFGVIVTGREDHTSVSRSKVML